MLLSKTVIVTLHQRDRKSKYFRDLGYDIPQVYNQRRKAYQNQKETVLEIKVEHIPPDCRTISVEWLCDYCLEEGIDKIHVSNWHEYRKHDRSVIEKDACGKHGVIKMFEMKRITENRLFDKETIKEKYLYLYRKIDGIPSQKHVKKEHDSDNSFPTVYEMERFYGSFQRMRSDLIGDAFKEKIINEFREYVSKNGFPNRSQMKPSNNLRDIRTYQRCFGVIKIVDIIKYCGISLTPEELYRLNKMEDIENRISKTECSDIIYNMENELGRPLMYDDFRNPKDGRLSFNLIKHYWGTMNEMKKDLGLKINQENMMIKQKSFENLLLDIEEICNSVLEKEDRMTITKTDFINYGKGLEYSTYSKRLKENGTSLRIVIENLGFKILKSGMGYNHTFEDGEKTYSIYEYKFSEMLKSEGFEYNKDYFRDVRYASFIPDCRGTMNCDYVFDFNGKKFYIEIAGILKDGEKRYYSKNAMSSKSKEKYAEKLRFKESLFIKMNLEYIVFFPYDYKNSYIRDMGKIIEKLKLIANHENIDTTQHYLKDNSVDELAEMFNIKIV